MELALATSEESGEERFSDSLVLTVLFELSRASRLGLSTAAIDGDSGSMTSFSASTSAAGIAGRGRADGILGLKARPPFFLNMELISV